MKSLLKFARLTTSEKVFFLNALFWMSYFRLALKLKPLQKLLKETQFKAGKQQPAKNNLTPSRVARLAALAGNLIPFSTCLSKSLAGHVLFARQGYDTKIHIGVSKEKVAGFEAHAWLTYNDIIVVGHLPDLAKYKELPF